MYKTIVLAYDGSQAGQDAILECEEITQWSHAHLWIVAVQPDPVASLAIGYAPSPQSDALESQAYEALLKQGVQKLEGDGYKASSKLLVGIAVHQISDFAKSVNADLIVVGHTHYDSWVERWWNNAISGALVEHAPCSVLCVVKRR